MRIGNGARLIRESRQSTPNMNNKIEIIESKSEMIGINPLAKISLMDSISLIVLVVKVPIGVCQIAANSNSILFYKPIRANPLPQFVRARK